MKTTTTSTTTSERSMSLLNHKKIAIIGGGPVGLTMARLIQQRGGDVSVYERDKDAQTRIFGGTLDLHQASGQAAMNKAGLLESYVAASVPMGRRFANEHGDIILSKAPVLGNPEINRNRLRRLLLESLTSDTVVWDRKVTALDAGDEEWTVHFDGHPSATADVVIVANGGMSKVRHFVSDVEAGYTGTYIIQGDVYDPENHCREFYQLCGDAILMAAHQGNCLVANPRNDSYLSYSVFFGATEAWTYNNGLNFQDNECIVRYLLGRLSNWDERYKQLIRATSCFIGLPTKKLSLHKQWKRDRQLPITLIGDAAHVMPPFAGQGVNVGLLDALVLSENLVNGSFDTVQDAIDNYEQQMFVYAAEAQALSAHNEKAMRNPAFSFHHLFSS